MTSSLPVAPPGDPHHLEDLWLPIGPTGVHGGQNAENADITGRVRQVAVSPSGRRVYAATAGGGVWYSSDEGSTWTSLGGWVTAADEAHFDFSGNSLTCGSLVVDWDPLDPAENDTVYVGTGEISPGRRGIPGGSLGGVGVLRAQSPAVTAAADPFAAVWTAEAPDLAGAGVYRLAMDPGDATRVAAASSVGLFLRTTTGGIASWSRVTTGPFGDRLIVTDAWWAPGPPSRLWVVVPGLGLYVTDDATATFHHVDLPDLQSGRLALGVSADGAVGYVLGDGPRLWRVAGNTAKRVSRVPATLFGPGDGEVDPDAAAGGAPSDLPVAANAAAAGQAFYDMVVAVDPGNPNRIVLGGAAIEVSNGALFVCRVDDPGGSPALSYDPASDVAPRSPSADPTFVGFGVHPDVHGALFAPRAGNLDLWVTCDGGIFRSRQADRYTWQQRNNGLAVTEPGYVACHPTVEGLVVVGTQDNGVLVREGDTRWRWAMDGDGGGVAFDPTAPQRFLAQASSCFWRSSDRTATQPVQRTTPLSTEQSRENAQALFYSTPGAVATTNPPGIRIAVGTNRVWVSDDFGASWYTVPTGFDPIKERLSEAFDVKYGDIHAEGPSRDTVVVCRWQDENHLVVLCERSLRRISRDASGRWSDWVVLTDKKVKCSAYTASDITGPVLDHLPPLGDWSDLALQPADPGGDHVPLYVACAGLTGTPAMDTLWWYDGAGPKAGKWYATGLRAAVRAPALSVVVHPTDPNTVYVGTTLGVWAGTVTPPDGVHPPTWDWSQYSKGLPEGAVQDLAIFRAQATDTSPALALLRAAVAARGVWEVDLLAACDELTYLRVHPLDVRRRFPTDVADTTTDPLRTGLIEPGGLASPEHRRPSGATGGRRDDAVTANVPGVAGDVLLAERPLDVPDRLPARRPGVPGPRGRGRRRSTGRCGASAWPTGSPTSARSTRPPGRWW